MGAEHDAYLPGILPGLADLTRERHAVPVSDADLRDLERRWRETCSAEDEAAWIRELVRRGELPPSRLRYAADCGDAAALLVLEDDLTLPRDLRQGLERFAKADVVLQARVAVALLQDAEVAAAGLWLSLLKSALSLLATGGAVRLEGSRLGAFEALEAWILCPCRSCASIASAASDLAFAEALNLEASFEDWRAPESHPEANHRHGCMRLSRASARAASLPSQGRFGSLVEPLFDLWGEPWEAPRARLQEEVVPWLLGQSDPVRERVEARQREAVGE